MKRWPLDPAIHPTAPERMRVWHALTLGQVQARKTWRLLARHALFELRECPVCRRPVIRWRRFDEIKQRILVMALRASGGNASLAARRLKMSRKGFCDNLTQELRERIAKTKQGKPESAS